MSEEPFDRKPLVVFVCTANSARSQMAEAFLRKYGGNIFNVASAGTTPAEIHPLTIDVMEEAGIDVSQHRSKSVREFLGTVLIRYLIIVCEDHEEECPRVWPGVVERLYWPFDDPVTAEGHDYARLEKFRLVRDAIEQTVKSWVANPQLIEDDA